MENNRKNKKTFNFSQTLIFKVMQFEGLRLVAYRDAGGVLTIGYGHTGGKLKKGDTMTKDEAYSTLCQDLSKKGRFVNALGVCETQGQFDALTDFCFNLGTGALNRSTLLKKIRAGAPTAEIQAEFRRWVHCNGKVLDGLVKRREWEAERWVQ